MCLYFKFYFSLVICNLGSKQKYQPWAHLLQKTLLTSLKAVCVFCWIQIFSKTFWELLNTITQILKKKKNPQTKQHSFQSFNLNMKYSLYVIKSKELKAKDFLSYLKSEDQWLHYTCLEILESEISENDKQLDHFILWSIFP